MITEIRVPIGRDYYSIVDRGYGSASVSKPLEFESIRVLIPGEPYDHMDLYSGKVILHHQDFYPDFDTWYKACKEDKYYTDLRHIILEYNCIFNSSQYKLPTGLLDDLISKGKCIRWISTRFPNYKIKTRKPILTEHDKLKEKFSYFDHGLDFEGLKELNEWFEDLRYKEDDRD